MLLLVSMSIFLVICYVMLKYFYPGHFTLSQCSGAFFRGDPPLLVMDGSSGKTTGRSSNGTGMTYYSTWGIMLVVKILIYDY